MNDSVRFSEIPQYIAYDLGTVLLIIGGMAVCARMFRKRWPELRRAAYASEVVLLFLCLGNFMVPGSWRDFYITEAIHLLLAGCTAALATFASTRSSIRPTRWTPLLLFCGGLLFLTLLALSLQHA